ncbi:epoxide hydrolase family protein [Amycolatopsis pittospori]|uniref:epoxide hydrolase family protein n=1 Tax=Amycolatopsis pittospori TaxID=2749434 RepID=UPI0015F08A65|nr:epoxide hydrolase family protein [Amycolatopsis pittospori]
MIEPFEVRIPESAIADLRARLRGTRWPEPATVDDWDQGVPLEFARELCRYWAEDYDFGLAGRGNAFPGFKTTVDGLGIHFLHVRSPEPDAIPLVLTHGWPGSVVEFLDVLGPLTDPRAHGGDPADAFHVVAPSLPGFGWSDKPAETGWTVERIARAWDELMGRLGYERYAAQGGDWGAGVTNMLAKVATERLIGVHVNMATVSYDAGVLGDPTAEEREAIADLARFRSVGSAYAQQQGTRPQTLGYGLTDSPAAQAAWIAEKFWEWTDNDGSPETALSWRRMLDAISVYWFTGTATSSARIYWESKERDTSEVTVPSGISIFPREIIRPSRRWAELRYTDLRWYEQLAKGGHFAAFEQPEVFVGQLRGFFRSLR